jgi:hypothetical protein
MWRAGVIRAPAFVLPFLGRLGRRRAGAMTNYFVLTQF